MLRSAFLGHVHLRARRQRAVKAELRLHGLHAGGGDLRQRRAARSPSRERGAHRSNGSSARLAPRFPQLRFAEVQYRIKSWNPSTRASRTRARRSSASAPSARSCSASRWAARSRSRSPTSRESKACSGSRRGSPTSSRLEPLRGTPARRLPRLARPSFPGIPGVSPASSHRGFERAQAARRARHLHADPRRGARDRAASRARPVPLPQARAWVSHVSTHLEASRATQETTVQKGSPDASRDHRSSPVSPAALVLVLPAAAPPHPLECLPERRP